MIDTIRLHDEDITKLARALAEELKRPEKWVGIDVIAETLGVSLDTVYYWTSKTDIPHNKKGKELRFKLSDVEKWYYGRKVVQ